MKFTIILLFLTSTLPLWAQTLDEFIEAGYSNAHSLRLKQGDLNKAAASLNEAKSRKLPTVEMQATATYISNPPEGLIITKGSLGYSPSVNSQVPQALPEQDMIILEGAKNTYFKISTTVTQPLFTWNKINNSIRIAELDSRAAQLAYKKGRRELKKEISTAYYSLLLAEKSIPLLEEAVSIGKEILTDRESAFDEGLINFQKVLEAKTQLARLENSLIRTKEGFLSGKEAMDFYTTLKPEEGNLKTDFRKNLPQMDEEVLKKRALEVSEERAILIRRELQARYLLEIEKGSDLFRPDLSLVANLDITGQDVPLLDLDWIDTWNVGLTVTLAGRMTLYNGNKSKNTLIRTRATLGSAKEGLAMLEAGLLLQVRQAIGEVNMTYYTLLEKEAILAYGEEQYKNARVSFENDLLTRMEERGARILLNSQKLEYFMGKFNFEMALVGLEYLTEEQK